AWLAERGLQVVAVEPQGPMLELARRFNAVPAIRWLSDDMPRLDNVFRLGLSFDFILVSAAWMSVAPADRPRAFRKLVTLLKPGGRLAVTLRLGLPPTNKGMHPVSVAELEALARA